MAAGNRVDHATADCEPHAGDADARPNPDRIVRARRLDRRGRSGGLGNDRPRAGPHYRPARPARRAPHDRARLSAGVDLHIGGGQAGIAARGPDRRRRDRRRLCAADHGADAHRMALSLRRRGPAQDRVCPRCGADRSRIHAGPDAGRRAAGDRLTAHRLRRRLASGDAGRACIRMVAGFEVLAPPTGSSAACSDRWPTRVCWPFMR